MTAATAEENHGGSEGPETPEESRMPEQDNAEGDSADESEFDVEEYLESESSEYESFSTVDDLYRGAEDPSQVDENVEVVYQSESDIYMTEESLEEIETTFEEIDKELDDDSDTGILSTVKEYGNKAKEYISQITPNDKWDWAAYGSGLVLGGIGFATGSIGLGAAGFLLEGIGLYRSNNGKEDAEQPEDEESEEYELGELEPVKDKEIKAISRDSVEEIQEEYQGE